MWFIDSYPIMDKGHCKNSSNEHWLMIKENVAMSQCVVRDCCKSQDLLDCVCVCVCLSVCLSHWMSLKTTFKDLTQFKSSAQTHSCHCNWWQHMERLLCCENRIEYNGILLSLIPSSVLSFFASLFNCYLLMQSNTTVIFHPLTM